MSPEVFQSQKFGEASDVWAYGVTLVELYSQAATPYGAWSNILVLERIKDGYVLPRPADCPAAIYDAVIAPCFSAEPRDRPSFWALRTRLSTLAQLESPLLQLESPLAELDSPVASPPPMPPSQNTGGGGRCVAVSALAELSPLPTDDEADKGDGVGTDGAYFGFQSLAQSLFVVDAPQAAVAARRSTAALSGAPHLENSGAAIGFASFDGVHPHRRGSGAAPSPINWYPRGPPPSAASAGQLQHAHQRHQVYGCPSPGALALPGVSSLCFGRSDRDPDEAADGRCTGVEGMRSGRRGSDVSLLTDTGLGRLFHQDSDVSLITDLGFIRPPTELAVLELSQDFGAGPPTAADVIERTGAVEDSQSVTSPPSVCVYVQRDDSDREFLLG